MKKIVGLVVVADLIVAGVLGAGFLHLRGDERAAAEPAPAAASAPEAPDAPAPERAMRRALAAAGVDADRPAAADPARAWRAFKRFARTPLPGTEAGLLFEYGTYDWGDGPAFEVDFVRQVEQDAELFQLRVSLRFAPEPFERFEGTPLWSDGGRARFLSRVQRTPAFLAATRGGVAPFEILVDYAPTE